MTGKELLTDLELVKYCLKGDRKKQEILYRRYASKMYATCLAYAKDKDDAKDILQDGFVKVFTSLKNYNGSGSLEGWIKKIIVNTAIDYYRKSLKDLSNTDFRNEIEKEVAPSILDRINTEELMNIVHKLPEGARIIFNLYAIEGYNHVEIAKILNISEGTSKSQFSRARYLLQEKINNIYNLKTVLKN